MSTRLSVLIIDDSEDDRELYARYLRSDPETEWRIFEAETGHEGKTVYGAHDIDCVMLDYSLPGQDGLEVLRDIKGDACHVPIVILTGQGSELIATEAMKNGAQDYLSKGSLTSEGLVRTVRNMVERVRMLRRIEEQQEERKAFARIMAHDLKQPLSVIRGMNRYIAEAVQEDDFEEVPELTQRIEQAARRMTDLIDTMRQFEKAAEGTYEFKPLSLADAVDDAVANLAIEIEKRNAEIVLGNMPVVMACEPLLIQLLQNLIGNAIKYCEADVPQVHISGCELDNAWEIVVRDNGIGIPEEYHDYVFEPTHRLHGYDEYEGSGLGLATCRKIVQRHGGRIWCRDASAGTAFHFTLARSNVNRDRESERAA